MESQPIPITQHDRGRTLRAILSMGDQTMFGISSLQSSRRLKIPAKDRIDFVNLYWLYLNAIMLVATRRSTVPRLELEFSQSDRKWQWRMLYNSMEQDIQMLSGAAAEACIPIARMLPLDKVAGEGLVAYLTPGGNLQVDVVDLSNGPTIATFDSHLDILRYVDSRPEHIRKQAKRAA